MSTISGDVLYELTDDDCWALLERGALGRLAVVVRGEVDVFPVNYVAADRRVLFKTNEGTKLAALTVDSRVVFEIDGADEQTAWSVVVKGTARTLEREDERAAAERLRIVSWLPTAKSHIVVVEPAHVTGRGFVRGPEPDDEWY